MPAIEAPFQIVSTRVVDEMLQKLSTHALLLREFQPGLESNAQRQSSPVTYRARDEDFSVAASTLALKGVVRHCIL